MQNKVLDRFNHVLIAALAIAFLMVATVGCKGYGKPPTKDEASTRSVAADQPEDGTAEGDD